MIITRSPLRVTLGGGGTDLPSYYESYGGFLIAAAIDRYVYITIHDTFQQEFIIKYSRLERVNSIGAIEHPIIRESLRLTEIDENGSLEITSMADIPAGTGLGSSGSFTTALLKALHAHQRNLIHPAGIGGTSMRHRDQPSGRTGWQAGSIHRGLWRASPALSSLQDGKVRAWPLRISEEMRYDLEDNLLLFFTGYSRSASTVLKEQNDRSKTMDPDMLANLHFVKELAVESQQALEGGDLKEFARLMNVHWQNKKKRSNNMSNSHINDLYDLAMANGALGGKLIGAGGGGFLMFYSEEKTKLRHAMREQGLKEVRFKFDFEGTKLLSQ